MAPTPPAVHQLSLQVQLKKPTPVLVAVNLPPQQQRGGHLGVALGAGAGGGLASGTLPAWAEAISAAGLPCVRYEVRAPSLPHRVAVLKELLLHHAASLPGCAGITRWVLAGHSLGGRVAAQVAAELPDLVGGLLLLSYPVHPPGKPAQLRDKPLASLRQPLLFVRGTRDAFSTPEPWEALLPRLGSRRWSVHEVAGGDHGLHLLVSAGGEAASAVALQGACAAAQAFLRQLAAEAEAGAVQQPLQGTAAGMPVGSVGRRRRRGKRQRDEESSRQEEVRAAASAGGSAG